MATQDPTVRARIEGIKADLRSTSTCSDATVIALQELLFNKTEGPVEKENVRVKVQATARRRAGTAAVSSDNIKQPSITLAPKQRYVLATEVANTTLKTLADALKNPPAAILSRPSAQSKPTSETTRKPTKPRTGHAKTTLVSQKPLKERPASQLNNSPQKPSLRRSLSHSAVLTLGPDAGLVATAECARVAFGYLGTAEAAKVLGKDAQTLQYENGLLVLVGKLVALGLNSLAVKELRALKIRIDVYLDHEGDKKKPLGESAAFKEKETLASLLEFGTIDLTSPAVPLVATFQTYVLRVIAKLKKPQTIEAAWNSLTLSNPSSPTNLIWHAANTPNAQAKAARQLESLAQTILAMCPSISRADDANPAHPSAKTVLLLQHLAFKIRTKWWTLVKHQRNELQELWDPFAKCVIAFARRSQLSLAEKYKLAKSLYADLAEQLSEADTLEIVPDCNSALSKVLSSLAQSANLSDEALHWLGPSSSSPNPVPGVKQASRLIQIAIVSIEALLKGDLKPELDETIASALNALNGSLGGSTSDIDALFVEVNALRRAATRLLVASVPESGNASEQPSTQQHAAAVIKASMHFSARFVGAKPAPEIDSKARMQHDQRMTAAWNYLKSIIDSVMTCCKQVIECEDQWRELDTILQNCLHVLCRIEEDAEYAITSGMQKGETIRICIVKISNAYWAKQLQLRKAKLDPKCSIKAMQRSVDILSPRSQAEQEAGHLPMKLEQLGETLEDLDYGKLSRKAFEHCIQSHLSSNMAGTLSQLAGKCSLQKTFRNDGPLNVLARVLRAYHRSFMKFSIQDADELAFYDDNALEASARGALLEWQLGLYLRTLSRNRHWDTKLNKSVASLAERLQDIYTPEKFPLRRLRISIMLSQLSQNQSEIWSEELAPPESLSKTAITNSEDTKLKAFERHLRALYSLKLSMQQSNPSTSTFREDFQTWDDLVSSVSSWEAFTDHVDNIEDWLQDAQASVELLNARGEEYLALPVLRLLVKVFELQEALDTSDLTNSLCSLGLQFLRLGYTGKAGLTFARVEIVIEKHAPSTEARLLWHISYAEYLLAIGNKAKCETIMADARSMALAGCQFMDLAKPSTTLSGRMRFNRILADASYIYSLCATANGSYKEAVRHAKQCVSLNRRIWAAYESRINAKKTSATEDVSSHTDTSTQGTFDPLSSMRNDKGIPLVMSITHNALCGPQFWSLVPALYRALMQHSQIFAHQGLLQEAMYVAEQAEKVASATNSPTLITDNVSWRADCWSQSGRTDKAETLLKSIAHLSSRKCVSVVGYHAALARTHHTKGQYSEEIASYDTLEQLLGELSSPAYIKSLDAFSPSTESLVEQMSNLDINATGASNKKGGATGRNPTAKSGSRAVPKPASKARPKARATAATTATTKTIRPATTSSTLVTSSIADQCSTLSILRVTIMDRGVLANIMQDDLTQALSLLTRAETLQGGLDGEISHIWAAFKARFAQSFKQITENVTVNTLPESTIAFPAIGLKERRTSDVVVSTRIGNTTSAPSKSGRAKKQTKEDFVDILRDARDHLVEAHGLSAVNGSNHLFQQISVALGHVTVLLSAVSVTDFQGSVHPLYAAYMSEIPKCNALRLAQDSVEADKEQLSRDDCLQWPVATSSSFVLPSVLEFQRDCIDTIPETWAAVSLALNEDHNELFVTRFEQGMSPFVLRLPLARHASRDMDEEEFSFEDGKRDFDEIIELSDFSTKTAKDMTSREARHQWWAEREALDARLGELLLNMENIWLGGFKGIFSQHERQPSLLARFRKSFENILTQHLPSRRKKSQQKRPVLDPRVLELFIGLGDANNEGLDMDEALMDLVYFVIDILQFNGEKNAYDEIDFDAMIVETHDALRAYHNSSHTSGGSAQHTILILDKNLHAFPWESLPCLEQLSISRLPSLVALRERILAARDSCVQVDAAPGHYIRVEAGGTSILNPSGDLTHTLKMIKPRLDDLQGSWNHITGRAPSEKEFEDALRENELVLYFGHGSGAQYVKSKSVRRLYSSQQENAKPNCATTLLFGCSSVHLTENGVYEPSGMLASYLTAGAPAVVGMLWDVTDKDCDRFAVKAGELWGLWPEAQEDVSPPKTPAKTPARRGKGRVAQLVESAGGSSSERKSGKGKGKAADNSSASQDCRRGLGLDDAVKEARKSCVLRYLNGAAAVVYGIPVYLE